MDFQRHTAGINRLKDDADADRRPLAKDEQIKAASQAYKTLYSKQDGDDPEFYLMNHSNFTYLMLPDHGFVEFFRAAPSDVRPGLEAEPMADQVACFLDAV